MENCVMSIRDFFEKQRSIFYTKMAGYLLKDHGSDIIAHLLCIRSSAMTYENCKEIIDALIESSLLGHEPQIFWNDPTSNLYCIHGKINIVKRK
jgi:hypothetical protein